MLRQVDAAKAISDEVSNTCSDHLETFTISLINNIVYNIHSQLNMDCNAAVSRSIPAPTRLRCLTGTEKGAKMG